MQSEGTELSCGPAEISQLWGPRPSICEALAASTFSVLGDARVPCMYHLNTPADFFPLFFIRAEFSTRGQCAALDLTPVARHYCVVPGLTQGCSQQGRQTGGHLTLRASSIPVVSGCVQVGTPVATRPHVSCPVWELRALLTDHQAAVLGGSPRPQKPSRNQPATALKGDISAKAPAKPLG